MNRKDLSLLDRTVLNFVEEHTPCPKKEIDIYIKEHLDKESKSVQRSLRHLEELEFLSHVGEYQKARYFSNLISNLVNTAMHLEAAYDMHHNFAKDVMEQIRIYHKTVSSKNEQLELFEKILLAATNIITAKIAISTMIATELPIDKTHIIWNRRRRPITKKLLGQIFLDLLKDEKLLYGTVRKTDQKLYNKLHNQIFSRLAAFGS